MSSVRNVRTAADERLLPPASATILAIDHHSVLSTLQHSTCTTLEVFLLAPPIAARLLTTLSESFLLSFCRGP